MADWDNDRVQVLNSDLTFSNTFGKKGSGKGQFDSPWGIACDSTGKVYVADTGNHRIQVFTAEGKFLMMFGRFGDGRGNCGCLLVLPLTLVALSEGHHSSLPGLQNLFTLKLAACIAIASKVEVFGVMVLLSYSMSRAASTSAPGSAEFIKTGHCKQCITLL